MVKTFEPSALFLLCPPCSIRHLTLSREFTYSAFNRDASDSIYELLYLPLLVLYE